MNSKQSSQPPSSPPPQSPTLRVLYTAYNAAVVADFRASVPPQQQSSRLEVKTTHGITGLASAVMHKWKNWEAWKVNKALKDMNLARSIFFRATCTRGMDFLTWIKSSPLLLRARTALLPDKPTQPPLSPLTALRKKKNKHQGTNPRTGRSLTDRLVALSMRVVDAFLVTTDEDITAEGVPALLLDAISKANVALHDVVEVARLINELASAPPLCFAAFCLVVVVMSSELNCCVLGSLPAVACRALRDPS